MNLRQTRALPALLAAALLLNPLAAYADNATNRARQVEIQDHGAPVQVTGTPTNGQQLTFNSTTGTWVAGSAGGGETWAQTLALGSVSGGTSPTISAGDYMIFANSSGAAVSGANTGRIIYNSATQTFQVSLNGATYTSLATGTVTLQGAYDGGPNVSTTTTSAWTNNAANNNPLMTFTKNPAGAQSGNAVSISMGANTSGHALGITLAAGTGSGVDISTAASAPALHIGTSGVAAGASGIYIEMGAGSTAPAIDAFPVNQTNPGPALNATHTWNSGGSTLRGILFNVTNTASAAASRLLDLQVSSSSVFGVDTSGQAFGIKGMFSSTIGTTSNAILNANDASYAGVSSILFTGTDNATPDRFYSCSDAGADFDKRLILYRSRGTMASQSSISDGDWVGGVYGQCLTGGGFTTQPAGISFRAQGTVGSGNVGGAILFLTNPDGSGTQSERLAIRNNASAAFPSGGFLAWTSSASDAVTGTIDTNLSRNSAGWIQAGTTTANASGNVMAAKFGQSTTVFSTSGSGSPEGAVTASKGSLYTDTATGDLYKKTTDAANTGWSAVGGSSSSATLFYGDGSSGSATMDGSTVCYGLTPAGNVYTATANIYATSLTIDAGVTLNMANYRLFCSVSLTNNGTIHCNGSNTVGTNVTAVAAGFFGVGPGGSNGTTTTNSSIAGNSATAGSPYGAGGGGGRSDGTQQSAGTAGTPSTASLYVIRTGLSGGSGVPSTVPFGAINSASGGRGSGDGTNAGGGPGAGGVTLVVAAKSITTGASGAYQANGGNGGNGAGGTAGGGGGGAGGCVILYYDTASGTALSGSNVTASGGSGGTGQGGAGNGTNGVAGSTFIIQRQ